MITGKVFEAVDRLYPQYLQFWKTVCETESPTMDKARIDKLGELFTSIAIDKGWLVETFDSPNGNAICITMNPDANKEAICLSAHMDTAHKVGAFGTPAVTMDEEKIYGPGVTDCKGGLVIAMLAMDALSSCGFTERPVRFLLQSDEEAGSRPINKPTVNYICEKAAGARAFFNLEGGEAGCACVERKGILTYTVRVTGVEAHSSLCAKMGASAIADAAHRILELERFKDDEGITCSCGIISGGKNHNTVPGFCEFRANFRFANSEQYNFIVDYMAKLESRVFVEGCRAEIEEYGFRPAMEYVQRNIELLETVNEIFKSCGLDEWRAVDAFGGSDASYITMREIPCLDNVGVVGGNIHTLDEYAIKESLREHAKRMCAVICCI